MTILNPPLSHKVFSIMRKDVSNCKFFANNVKDSLTLAERLPLRINPPVRDNGKGLRFKKTPKAKGKGISPPVKTSSITERVFNGLIL